MGLSDNKYVQGFTVKAHKQCVMAIEYIDNRTIASIDFGLEIKILNSQ